ncbi:patatin-like phospholipase family protein [Motiliproteus coralliicola]|uniref:Patatin-like phospholipase family protein n=1 Tax=Motiliproteus coralliicola TaxID=2283196 RepID=A0A369WBR2_9GAMM|nr:patatin-like phospholipase family protein [Motiliproteus coralliicola]RDE18066.1 patatin-like phospholipase family protein [Motiliproteus coralliicola]
MTAVSEAPSDYDPLYREALTAVPIRNLLLVLLSLVITGCASQATISNKDLSQLEPDKRYAVFNLDENRKPLPRNLKQDVSLSLAFSGGGTRAAALAYGVLLELRDTPIYHPQGPQRLLDEVDMISSVSGGSFTSAYYGLYGERTFDEFEKKFLRHNVGEVLLDRLLSPSRWFSSQDRSEAAVQVYQDRLFEDKTFADLQAAGGPMIIINASDLGRGVRFSFLQDYFDLLCSDLSSFPVAKAVTASSAVPVLFAPVVLKNHDGCRSNAQSYLQSVDTNRLPNQVAQVVSGLKTYSDKQQRQYIHLVDGGITDNLGLMAIYEMVEVAGGIEPFMRVTGGKPARNILIISVNASTYVKHEIELTKEEPSLEDTLNTVTDVQLHRYNAATLDLLRETTQNWSGQLSTEQRPVNTYFVELSFETLTPEQKDYFNRIPTSFNLEDEQVDRLIELGRNLLRQNSDFRRFLDNYAANGDGDPLGPQNAYR